MQHKELRWEYVGGPSGGTVTGLVASPSFACDGIWFAATMAGLFRSDDGGGRWRRTGNGFEGLSLTAIAISPGFSTDGLLLAASLETGIYRVIGDTWVLGDVGGRQTSVAGMAISPEFTTDGIAFAATLADGVFHSRDHGAHWEPCNFGLLDLEVLALTISPRFGRDETLFAATATGLFRSQNGGRAWREVGFPIDGTPVLCLAISPNFDDDGAIFAGTDGAGLFRSLNRGATWHPVHDLPDAATINGIVCSPAFTIDHTMMVITDSAVYVSRDAGERWSYCTQAQGALCLAVAPTFRAGGPVLVGSTRDGIYRSNTDLASWQTANEGLAGHALTGLALSPGSDGDQRLFMYGAGAGVLQSDDGGQTWVEADDGLPSLQVTSLASGTMPDRKQYLIAALPQGVWCLRRGEVVWEQIGDRPARLLALAPTGGALVMATNDGDLWIAEDTPLRWRPLDIPWQRARILALAFGQDRQLFVAIHQPDTMSVAMWQRNHTDGWEKRVEHRDAHSAAIGVPSPTPLLEGIWYAAAGDQVFGPLTNLADVCGATRLPIGQVVNDERSAVIALAVVPGPRSASLLAATVRGLYHQTEGNLAWRLLDDPARPRPIIAVASSPNSSSDGCSYALEIGGALWCLRQSSAVP